MFVKVEALFEIKEGQLSLGKSPLHYLAQRIDDTVPNGFIKTVIIEVTVPIERSLIINKT